MEPGQREAPPSTSNNSVGLLALIFGILSAPLGLCCWPLGLASGIGGLVLGFLALRKAADGTATGRGMAIAGAICGVAGILVTILYFAAGVAIGSLDLPY